ncbi:hypothetical protein [Streptomyces nigrescens]|uniref:hypothetical protein n=1 Tax=Streptomyces nigrescens TaxID=1920 RepID=UPI00367CF3CC
MDTNDDHVQYTWNLLHPAGDRIVIDLWTDDESVRVDGGDGESYSGTNARKIVEEQLLPKYADRGYQVESDYLVNDPHDSGVDES